MVAKTLVVALGVGLPVNPGVEKGVVDVPVAEGVADVVTRVLGAVAVVVALVTDVALVAAVVEEAGDVGSPVAADEVVITGVVVVLLVLEHPVKPMLNNITRMKAKPDILITLFFITKFLLYELTFKLLL